MGTLLCVVSVNKICAVYMLDTGSGISILSKSFVSKHGFAGCGWDPPLVLVVSVATISLSGACEVHDE